MQAASYLVLGAAAAAVLRVAVPPWVFQHLAGHLVLGVLTMALFAVVLALCSEADAFVAASLTMLPLLPRLVFLVVGPAVDVKLSAMQAGLFGRPFAIRFGPATFVVATVVATIVGLVFLGGASVSRGTQNTLLLLVGLSSGGDGDQGHIPSLREAGAAAVADRRRRRVDRARGGVHRA